MGFGFALCGLRQLLAYGPGGSIDKPLTSAGPLVSKECRGKVRLVLHGVFAFVVLW